MTEENYLVRRLLRPTPPPPQTRIGAEAEARYIKKTEDKNATTKPAGWL